MLEGVRRSAASACGDASVESVPAGVRGVLEASSGVVGGIGRAEDSKALFLVGGQGRGACIAGYAAWRQLKTGEARPVPSI